MADSQEEAEISDTMALPPPRLRCPECDKLLSSAVLLPCCATCLCRPCAFKRLAMNKKKCWLSKTDACNDGVIPLDKITPALKIRELVQDYSEGGEKYKFLEEEDCTVEENDIEHVDPTQALITHKPIQTIKTENQNQQEEEYTECSTVDVNNIKSELNTALLSTEDTILANFSPVQTKVESGYLNGNAQGNKVVDLKKEVIDVEEFSIEEPFPNSKTLPNTPSSARTEHQSSGYWSDDSYGGTFFGKLSWHLEDPTLGSIECWEGDERKIAMVRRLEVKCGAETGDLVEFTLSTDSEQRKVAKRVKLVEKALPVSEEDQIRSQVKLKRSVEMSSGILSQQLSKKFKMEDIVYPEVMQDMETGSIDYNDIVDEDFIDKQELGTDFKSEFASLLAVQDEPSDTCICQSTQLRRCGVCPMWFLRSESENTILEGESVTFLAKIENQFHDSQEEKLRYVKHLSFPFLVNPGTPDFSALTVLGLDSIIKKISPVFSDCYVFVTMMNETDVQVNVSQDSILGICQASHVEAINVSPYYIMEPSNRQSIDEIPIAIKRRDFSRYEKNLVCGFAEIGEANMNYNHALVKISLNDELRNKFSLNKSELTVQVKRNIWLELAPKVAGGYVNLLPTAGIIGWARPVTDQLYVTDYLNPHQVTEASPVKSKKSKEEDDHYMSMLSKLEQEASGNEAKTSDKTFRGETNDNVTIMGQSDRKCVLYLTSDDGTDPKSLLKLDVQVTTNDEFQYFNNCYTINTQVTPVIEEFCHSTNTTRPAVKVIVKNLRSEVTYLPKNSAIAVIRINKNIKDMVKPVGKARRASDQMHNDTNDVKLVKKIEKLNRKLLNQWEQFLDEKIFEHSLLAEEKYPYFSLPQKPKIPFGMSKMTDLLMRVGTNQAAPPKRILAANKNSNVFTCTLCDALILDRYNLQDHIYSVKHKTKMKSVQVIAGPQERLFLKRAHLQELIDHLDADVQMLLVGLDLVIEVLQGDQRPLYHCVLCRQNYTDARNSLATHLISTSHVLNFLKENFPVAWQRFSTMENQNNWSKLDHNVYFNILRKIQDLCGPRKLGIVENFDRLHESIDNIPDNLYTSYTEQLHTFVSSQPVVDKNTTKPPSTSNAKKDRTIARVAVCREQSVVAPGAKCRVVCKIKNVSRAVADKFVLVSRHSGNTICGVQQGFCKVYLNDDLPCVTISVFNSSKIAPINIAKGTELALVKWKK